MSTSFTPVKPSASKSKTLTYKQFKRRRVKRLRDIAKAVIEIAGKPKAPTPNPDEAPLIHPRTRLPRRVRRKAVRKYPSWSPPANSHVSDSDSEGTGSEAEKEMFLNISSEEPAQIPLDDFEFIPELSHPPVSRYPFRLY